MKGDLVGGGANVKERVNHLLTGNPKTVMCGKFNANGWPEPIEGAKTCTRCDGTYRRDPNSRPLADTYPLLGGAKVRADGP